MSLRRTESAFGSDKKGCYKHEKTLEKTVIRIYGSGIVYYLMQFAAGTSSGEFYRD